MNSIKSPLETAVEKTDDVKGNFKTGLNAINGNERDKFIVPDSCKISGSLNIDVATKSKYPEDNRWDYAIEYDNETFFVEIHPGSTSDIKKVLDKLSWLKSWLSEKAPEINKLKPKSKPAYYWLYTNKFAILPGSRYAKILSTHNLKPTKQWVYENL